MVGVYEAMGSGETVDRIISILAIDHSSVWILTSWLKNQQGGSSIFPRLMPACSTILFYSNIDWTLLGQLNGTCKIKTLFKGGHKKLMDYILKIVWEADKTVL